MILYLELAIIVFNKNFRFSILFLTELQKKHKTSIHLIEKICYHYPSILVDDWRRISSKKCIHKQKTKVHIIVKEPIQNSLHSESKNKKIEYSKW